MTPYSWLNRKIRHAQEKLARANQRLLNAQAGALPEIAPERTVPRLSFINLKTRSTSFGSRSGFSGHRTERSEGNIENASRTLATEIDKILNPKEEEDGKEIESAIEGRVNPQVEPSNIEG